MKTVLLVKSNAAGPNGLAGREGRDTPADYRRVIAVLNFLKPCFPFLAANAAHGLVMELVYVLDSKSRFCGFESHPGHQ